MRPLATSLAVLASGTGFAGLLWGLTALAAAPPPVAPEAALVVPEPAAAGPVAAQDEPPAAVEIPAREEAPAGSIEVPDFGGTTALRAVRRGRALGLRVEIRDEDDPRRRVPASERLSMRTSAEGQSPPPGALVEEGATIVVPARYPRTGFAAGY